MINSIEEEIIKIFIIKSKQDRLMWELNSPKKREDVIWAFADTRYLNKNCLIPTEYMSAKQLERNLSALIPNSDVYYWGEDYIGKITLEQATLRAQEGGICIIYCGEGIGYYQGEQCSGKPPRFLLSKG